MYNDYRAVPLKKAILLKDNKEKMYCTVCGMTLHKFYKTNHSAKYNHSNEQYCSITCMIEDAIINQKDLTNFKVVDNVTLKFIKSEDAYFIVGSKKPGTMSMISKYAFSLKKDALKFQKNNGGKLMNFNKLIKLVKKNLQKDLNIIKKRQAKAIKKGALIYKKDCKKIDKEFVSVAEAKVFLKSSKICGELKGKKLQALGLFLLYK